MEKPNLEEERKVNIEYLNAILKMWCSEERKQRKALACVLVICAIAVYYFFFDLLGGTLGFIITITLLYVGIYAADSLGLGETKDGLTDHKLARLACETMEILIEIEKGTYKKHGYHVITTGSGRHGDLYKQFIQFYPEYKCRALKKMTKL